MGKAGLEARAGRVRRRRFPNGEWVLGLALVAEIGFFAVATPQFFAWGNLFELLRYSVELGLLALAMTPILITGGIDLSVGSTVGLVAVVLGMTWKAGLPMGAAVAVALGVGCGCGLLNAVLIARLRLPSLIVTVGTFSLYRGIAEGLTHGAVSFIGFPKGFLWFGQGYVARVVPVQVLVFALVGVGYGVLLHRSVIGRGLYAIGFNAEGARYAALPVRQWVGLVYLLSGGVAGLAGVIYVAHLGLAKSDLGTGFELGAITAVLLGGTSVFGGRGTLGGSVLGLLFLSVLTNGMHLMALPSELTGVLTGGLLLGIVSLDRVRSRRGSRGVEVRSRRRAVVGGAATLVGGVLAVRWRWRRRHAAGGGDRTVGAGGRRLVIAVMPKAKGDPYFISARAGAEEAALELRVGLIWDGPTSLDASQQNETVENWITRGVDAIVVAVENRGSISTVLRKARSRGIVVLTWDADAEVDARDYFLNQATPEGIAEALTDRAGELLTGSGEFAIVTGALSAENQNEWIADIRKRVAERWPGLKLITVEPSDDDRDKAFQATETILKVYPEVRLVMAVSAPAVPGAAEAVGQSGRRDVEVIGLSLPSISRPYVKSGVVQTIYLWNTRDLGYLTVYAGVLVAERRIPKGTTSVAVGRLGTLEVRGSEIVLGQPLKIDRGNIDGLAF